MTQFEIYTDNVPAQIQITVFHPQVVTAVRLVFDGEGRGHGRIQNVQFGNDQFDLARGDMGVLARTFFDGTRYLNNIFASDLIGLLTK